jgi:hypothetical protein
MNWPITIYQLPFTIAIPPVEGSHIQDEAMRQRLWNFASIEFGGNLAVE